MSIAVKELKQPECSHTACRNHFEKSLVIFKNLAYIELIPQQFQSPICTQNKWQHVSTQDLCKKV